MILSNGLNIRKNKPTPAQTQTIRASIFGDTNSDDDEEYVTKVPHPQAQSSLRKSEVEEGDALYEYDGLYESMKSGERENAKAREKDKKERKPKYMQNLFEMAEVRKKDRLRAEDTRLQRERDEEGDEFKDKEKFVTSAYKTQQAEIRRLEEEEARKEAALRSHAGGFSAFNQNLLEKDLMKHEAVVNASLLATPSSTDPQFGTSQTLEDRDKVQEAEAKLGHKIALNDDNQIVDHRELLSAGLNRASKSDAHLKTANLSSKARPLNFQQEREDRQAQINRQQRVLQQQLLETRKREVDDEICKQDNLRAQIKRTKTEGEIVSAKDRYLARKEAMAAAKAASSSSIKDFEGP